MRMITVAIEKLSNGKVEELKEVILKYGAQLRFSEKKDEILFECPDLETKRLICKEIRKIKKE